MDVRPFEVVIVAHSTRLKELPLICLLQLADISRVSVCVQKASFTSLLFHVWFHNAFATFPPTPFSIQMYKHLDHFSFILPHTKFSIQFKLVNSTGNYLWGFEIFNTTSGRPLHGISKVVMLSLTNSVIELNECVMNALVDFQNSIP